MLPRCPYLKYGVVDDEDYYFCIEMSNSPCILEYQHGARCQMYDDWLDDQYAEWQAEHKKEESVCRGSLDEQRKNL